MGWLVIKKNHHIGKGGIAARALSLFLMGFALSFPERKKKERWNTGIFNELMRFHENEQAMLGKVILVFEFFCSSWKYQEFQIIIGENSNKFCFSIRILIIPAEILTNYYRNFDKPKILTNSGRNYEKFQSEFW